MRTSKPPFLMSPGVPASSPVSGVAVALRTVDNEIQLTVTGLYSGTLIAKSLAMEY